MRTCVLETDVADASEREEHMRVVVCGGRDYEDRDTLTATLSWVHENRGISLVIAGCARGADTLAEEWARARGAPCTERTGKDSARPQAQSGAAVAARRTQRCTRPTRARFAPQ